MPKPIVMNPRSEEPQATGYPLMAKLSYIAWPNSGKPHANPERKRPFPANTDATYLGYDMAKYEKIAWKRLKRNKTQNSSDIMGKIQCTDAVQPNMNSAAGPHQQTHIARIKSFSGVKAPLFTMGGKNNRKKLRDTA